MFTWPVAAVDALGAGARLADGQEDALPAAAVVAPLFRVEDHGALRRVAHHQAVGCMVDLATEATALQHTHTQFPRLEIVTKERLRFKPHHKGSP